MTSSKYVDDRLRHTMHNVTYDEKCTVILDRVGLIIHTNQGESSWCLTWERLEKLKQEVELKDKRQRIMDSMAREAQEGGEYDE